MVIFAATRIMLTSYTNSMNLIDLAQSIAGETQDIAYHMREVHLSALEMRPDLGNSTEFLHHIAVHTAGDLDLIQSTVFDLLDHSGGDPDIEDFWYTPRWKQQVFLLDNVTEVSQVNFWNLINRYQQSTRFVSNMNKEQFQNVDSISEWRYILDNRISLYNGLISGLDSYQSHHKKQEKTLQIVLISLMTVSGVLLIGKYLFHYFYFSLFF